MWIGSASRRIKVSIFFHDHIFSSLTNANRLLGIAASTGSSLTNPNQGPDIAGKPGGFQTAEDVTCDGSTATVTSLTAGEFKPYSGTLLYVENRSPVVRASDQTEDIKLIIEF